MKTQKEVFNSYYGGIFRYLRGLCTDEELAKNLSCETFFKASKSINNYNGDMNIKAWLCAIVKYKYFLYQRHNSKLPEDKRKEMNEQSYANYERMFSDKQLAKKMYDTLQTMQVPYREVYCLHIFGDMSFDEIGAINEKSRQWAATIFYRARMMMNKALEDKGNER